MNRTIRLGKFLGLEWGLRPTAIVGSLILWVIFSIIAYIVLRDWPTAVWASLICTDLHWLGDILHQSGHALAAKSTGYPQKRWIIQHILLTTLYPKDEPLLSPAVHIRRALGGAPVSLLIAAVAGYFAFVTPPASPFWLFILQFIFWENLLLYGLGALLPANLLTRIGFDTDGDTLYKLWRGRAMSRATR